MNNNESKPSFLPISYHSQKMEKILTINPTVFEPCHAKVDWEWSYRKLKNVKFLLHVSKSGQVTITPISATATREQVKTQELEALREKIEEIRALILKLSREVATKKDLDKTEKLLIKNQERLQTMLRENMKDLKRTLGRDIERNIGKQKAKKFWELLEKVATISDIIDFAKHVRDLLIFLHEQKIIQIALPFVLKMILG